MTEYEIFQKIGLGFLGFNKGLGSITEGQHFRCALGKGYIDLFLYKGGKLSIEPTGENVKVFAAQPWFPVEIRKVSPEHVLTTLRPYIAITENRLITFSSINLRAKEPSKQKSPYLTPVGVSSL